MKHTLKNQAVSLRQKGYMYAEIADKLHIARSTAKLWTFDVPLSERQNTLLVERKTVHQQAKMANLSARNHTLRLEREAALEIRAKSMVKATASAPEFGAIACAIMYWCEGTKDVSAGIKFANADPLLIQKFLHLLRDSFPIDENKLRALVHLHEYHDETRQLAYWSKITGIPPSGFHKSYIKPNTGKNRHENYPGCISLRYYDSSLGKLLKMIYSEYGQVL